METKFREEKFYGLTFSDDLLKLILQKKEKKNFRDRQKSGFRDRWIFFKVIYFKIENQKQRSGVHQSN